MARVAAVVEGKLKYLPVHQGLYKAREEKVRTYLESTLELLCYSALYRD